MYEHRDHLDACSREELETIALRAAIEIRMARAEAARSKTLSDIVSGLMIGVIICVAAYLVGAAIR
jgi:hypothetical protein